MHEKFILDWGAATNLGFIQRYIFLLLKHNHFAFLFVFILFSYDDTDSDIVCQVA